MVEAFKTDFNIAEDGLKNYIGKNVDAFSEGDVIRLGKVYRSLKDGVIGSEYFTDKMTPQESAVNQPPVKEKKEKPKENNAPAPREVNLGDL